MRSGFTMVETLLALVLFQVGVLALVASGAVVTRDLASANRRSRAHAIATERIEHLRARACPPITAGRGDRAGGITEFWRVEAAGSARVISDSIEYRLPAGRGARLVARGWAWCGT